MMTPSPLPPPLGVKNVKIRENSEKIRGKRVDPTTRNIEPKTAIKKSELKPETRRECYLGW